MKRFLLLLAIPFILCSCNSSTKESTNPPVTINLPKDNTVNGYRTEDSEATKNSSMPDTIKAEEITVISSFTQNSTSKNYCGNKNSKVFHSSSCGSVTSMKEENRVYFSSRQEFISNGYNPCGRCKP